MPIAGISLPFTIYLSGGDRGQQNPGNRTVHRNQYQYQHLLHPRSMQNPMPDSESSEANTLRLDRSAGAGIEATAGIRTPSTPYVKQAFNTRDNVR